MGSLSGEGATENCDPIEFKHMREVARLLEIRIQDPGSGSETMPGSMESGMAPVNE